ncbi:hypothetical protein Rhal01_02146 [Rubritalea halochordaticola]|uniref:DUF3325 domain-containing protein n=1 Tax=Rubritalea halochordaticola TaxID=714537 RepID=A0ABP9V1V8_9BACT
MNYLEDIFGALLLTAFLYALDRGLRHFCPGFTRRMQKRIRPVHGKLFTGLLLLGMISLYISVWQHLMQQLWIGWIYLSVGLCALSAMGMVFCCLFESTERK